MKFALFGHQIGYSLSPGIHREIAGAEFDYRILDVPPEEFDQAVEERLPEFSGFNVTTPYKVRIMRHCDAFDPPVRKIGAVNTVLNREGKWTGFNTDYLGFMRAFKKNIPDFLSYHPVVAGYGGAARAVLFALRKMGFYAATVYGGNSREKRLNFIFSMKRQLHMQLLTVLPDMPRIWINCTPAGSERAPGVPGELIPGRRDDILFDLNYAPVPTFLENAAGQKGIKTFNGLEMLVFQAVEAQKIWRINTFPRKTETDGMRSRKNTDIPSSAEKQ